VGTYVRVRSRGGILPRGAWLACVLIICGCSRMQTDPEAPRAPSRDEIPRTVALQRGSVIEGFATGVLRKGRNVGALRMTRHPVTVAAYRHCVAAGACPEPTETCSRHGRNPLDGPTWHRDGDAASPEASAGFSDADDLPLTCPGTAAAEAYCRWLGGRLPTLPEWLLASRGSEPQRFAWGRRAAACDEHPRGRPRAVQRVSSGSPDLAQAQSLFCHDGSPRAFHVGRRSGVISPGGLEDVLLTRGELLMPDSDSSFGACAPPVRGCVVYGLEAGAIDAVQPIIALGDEEQEQAQVPYGFRCVWDEEG
jgi:hypothetical protein